jgi:hypothetical protein
MKKFNESLKDEMKKFISATTVFQYGFHFNENVGLPEPNILKI